MSRTGSCHTLPRPHLPHGPPGVGGVGWGEVSHFWSHKYCSSHPQHNTNIYKTEMQGEKRGGFCITDILKMEKIWT